MDVTVSTVAGRCKVQRMGVAICEAGIVILTTKTNTGFLF